MTYEQFSSKKKKEKKSVNVGKRGGEEVKVGYMN